MGFGLLDYGFERVDADGKFTLLNYKKTGNSISGHGIVEQAKRNVQATL